MYERNPPRCECHECTQARWKMSLQGQIEQSNKHPHGLFGEFPEEAYAAEKRKVAEDDQ